MTALGVSPEAKQTLLSDPALFITHFFEHRLEGLKDFHLRLLHTATTARRGLILYPAAHGKTTLVSTLLPIMEICRNPNIRIGLIAKNNTDATGIMRSIQAELASNERLIDAYGPFKPVDDETKPWALEKMSVANRTLIAKEPTLAVFGSGAKTVLGHRTEWTICDDVITAKNSGTPEQRYSMREWFNQSVSTMPHPSTGRITVVGTLFDPSDLYNDLLEMVDPETGEPLWKVQREDAIVDEEKHLTLWPERWPWLALMEQKANGTLDFNKRFRNIAVDRSRMVFKEEYVKGGWIGKTQYPGCIDKTHKVGDYDPGMRRISGFDPAVGLGKSSKFCAHVTLGMGSCKHHERCIWVIDLHRDQMTLPQQAEYILMKHQEYDLWKSIVEANAYQRGLYDDLKRRMEAKGVALQIEAHYTGAANKNDPEIGVQAMSPWFENGWVHIPWGDQASQRKMTQLVDELVQYPGRTTDTVMAFWFAWKRLNESAPKFTSSNYLRGPKSSWRAMGNRRVLKNPYYAKLNAEE